MATVEGTHAYRERHGEFARTYFRRVGGCAVSSVGIGTYLGDATDAVDDGQRAALVAALEAGCNVVDTAINYRHQRSERVVGEALERAGVDRDAVYVATKGGFVPFDGERPEDPSGYVRKEYVATGVLDPASLARGAHCIAPDYLADQLDRSLANLAVDAVDCYHVHNPETQLAARSREGVYDQLEDAFARLEARAAAGDLRHYGVATWEAFRVPTDHERYLALDAVVERARRAADRVGNDATHFRAVQVPFNVVMADAFTVQAHGPDRDQSALRFAREAGIDVFASAPLAQGELLGGLPAPVADRLAGESAAQRAINFARSAPAVTAALPGTTQAAHARENVAAGRHEPLGADAFDAVFE